MAEQDDDVELVPGHRLEMTAQFIRFVHEHLQSSGERSLILEIPSRFIHSAFEHVQATNERTVTLLVESGEMVCIGVSTRQVIEAPRLTHAVQPTFDSQQWTPSTITADALVEVVKQHGPINVKQTADLMGIAVKDEPARQKIGRILYKLADQKVLRTSGKSRYRAFAIARASQDRMNVRTLAKPKPISQRSMSRVDITPERVIEQMRNAGSPVSSRTIGDMLGISRTDTVRSKITEVVRSMLKSGQARNTGTVDGGRLYELVELANVAQ